MKHSTKRSLSLLAALLLLLSALPIPGLAEAPGPAEPEQAPAYEYPEELIVGNPTEMRGDFFTEMFGNNTADIDVRSLIHGYNLVNWDQGQGVYVFDPTVVTSTRVVQDSAGNRTFFLILAEDLFYSDGTRITAWDYAFSLLLMMAPEMEQIGAKIYRAEHIRGYDAYITKRSQALAGVEVISDRQLAITIDAAFMPFFFETGLFLCVPYPISVIAPGCRVYDNGQGAYIGNIDQTVAEPIFTADLLRETVLNEETGYNSHPSVTSGPYSMTSFDGETAHFVINPYYKGTWVSRPELLPGYTPPEEGAESVWPGAEELPANYTFVTDDEGNSICVVRPTIERIAFRSVVSENVSQLLADGELHLVNKLTYGPAITGLLQSSDELDILMQNYPRVGMTFFTFSCEKPAVNEMAVRQAIAWCMDRDEITLAYTTGYGQRVDSYYGIGKWEYQVVEGLIDAPVHLLAAGESIPSNLARFQNLYAADETSYETQAAAWDALSLDGLTQYTVDTDRANSLLNDAGWTLNREGDTYRPGVDDVRCKQVDGELVALDLTMLYPEGNNIIDALNDHFVRHLEEVGIRVTFVPAPMDELLSSYYRHTERTTDMIYLGTNFHVLVDPSITYAVDDTILHEKWNNTFSDDQLLFERAVEMRKTQPGDLYTYMTRWIAFQERYNEVLPAIPLYSNIYFDFYEPYLQNYQITAHTTWGQAIVQAYFGEKPEEPEEPEAVETEEEPGEGETVIDG